MTSASSLDVRNVDVLPCNNLLPISRLQETNASFAHYTSHPPVSDSMQDWVYSACCPDRAVRQSHDQRGNSDEHILNRMVGILEQVVERVHQSSNIQPEKNVISRYRGRVRGCGVCGNTSHSTKSHCLRDRLCFSCFSPGHAQSACPQSQSGN